MKTKYVITILILLSVCAIQRLIAQDQATLYNWSITQKVGVQKKQNVPVYKTIDTVQRIVNYSYSYVSSIDGATVGNNLIVQNYYNETTKTVIDSSFNHHFRRIYEVEFTDLNQVYDDTFNILYSVLRLQAQSNYLNSYDLQIRLIKKNSQNFFLESGPQQVFEAFNDNTKSDVITNNFPLLTNYEDSVYANSLIINRINQDLANLVKGQNGNIKLYFMFGLSEQVRKKTELYVNSFKTDFMIKNKFSNKKLSDDLLLIDYPNAPSKLNINNSIMLSGELKALKGKTTNSVKTENLYIGDLRFKQWQSNTAAFRIKTNYYSDIDKFEFGAQFDTPTQLSVQTSFLESVPSINTDFEFKDPWLVEADGQTQLNTYKTYTGNQQFEVFKNTNIETEKISSHPTYLLKTANLTQNGIEFFEFARSTSNAQLIPTGTEGEQIVSVTNNNATINRTYKAKSHSSSSSVVGLDHRRKVVSSTNDIYRVYLSGINEFGHERLWIQSRQIANATWTNEVEIPLLQQIASGDDYSAYKNPAVTYSQGSVWIVTEALFDFMGQGNPSWDLLAIRIDQLGTASQNIEYKVIASKVNSPFISYAIDGFVGANKIAVAYLETTAYQGLKLAIANKNTSTNGIDIQHTSSGFSLWTSVTLSNLDIATSGNFMGITANANGSILFAEAIQQVYGAFYWNSGATQLIYGNGFSSLGTGASVTKWGSSAFKIAYNASMVVSGVTHYGIAYKNAGTNATNTAVSFLYGSSNPKTDVELSRSDVDMNSNSDGNIIFTYNVDAGSSDYLEQKKLMYGGAYTIGVQTISIPNLNRSMAYASSNSLALGVYSTSNQGLYKLNDMQTPTIPKTGEIELPVAEPLAAIAAFDEKKNNIELSFIGKIKLNQKSIPLSVSKDSLNEMALTDWFEWNGNDIELAFHAQKNQSLAYKLALADTNGVILQTWKPKQQASSPLFKLDEQVNESDFSQLTLTSSKISNTKEIVRLVAIKEIQAKEEVYVIGTFFDKSESSMNTIAEASNNELVEGEREYQLIQAYPNPFNPSTTIRYNLKQDANVSIQVYNIAGKLVKTLVNANKSVGFHMVMFDAGNLASGVYVVRVHLLGADGTKTVKTQQITLIK